MNVTDPVAEGRWVWRADMAGHEPAMLLCEFSEGERALVTVG